MHVCVSGKVHVNACRAQHTCNTAIPNGCFYELNGELDETMFAVQWVSLIFKKRLLIILFAE